MKYDIENMVVDVGYLDRAIGGCAGAIDRAFYWHETPQGDDFWMHQDAGKTPLDIDALKDIKRQYMHHTGKAGNLKDMHVRAGDVVRNLISGSEYTVKARSLGVMALWLGRGGGRWGVDVDKSAEDYTLISLADEAQPDTPKKCRDMTAKIGDIGTLRELDVNPGDVVQYCDSEHYAVAENRHLVNVSSGMDTGQYRCWDTFPKFRLISRATAQPTIWRDMTDAEKGALLLAAHDGKVIECIGAGLGSWSPCDPQWRGDRAYRVKPEPVRETVSGWWNGKNFHNTANYADRTHRITFDTIDGEPDCSTIKMERITKEESK